MLAALTAALFPWPQAQVDGKHGRWYLKDRHWLFGDPFFAFLNLTQAKAYPI
jgi:hypothetical protein